MIFQLVFWISLLALAYTFLGYALHVGILNRLFGKGRGHPETLVSATSNKPPRLSIILVVRDEEERILARISNLLDCSYEGERELIIVTDGCGDATVERVRAASFDDSVRLIEKEKAEGKASGLNDGVAGATGDVLVFADARQRFEKDALERLIAPIRQDETVAAVSGSLEIEPSSEGAAAGMDAYWRMEKWIRNEEARWDSVIGCTGAIYAIRKACFRPVPADTLIDDVVIPMQALVNGGRILFVPGARAFDPQALETRHENRRKVRTLAGNYQMLFRYPQWLLPWRNRCWWQLIGHKYLRLAGPWLLIACLVSSAVLAADSLFFQAVVAAQGACYLLAASGFVFPSARVPLLTIPSGFLFLQWQSMRALGMYFVLRETKAGGAWSSGTPSDASK